MTDEPAWLDDFLAAERLPASYRDTVEHVVRPLADRIAAASHPITVGVCGTQASGKSTLVAALSRILESKGLRTALLSIDDIYLTHEERQELARSVHPLLATRGPPGTHDVRLGLETLDGLYKPGAVALPRFDKARDTRKPASEWDSVSGPVDVVLFEGWCVGALAQDQAALAAPVNALERDEDPDGAWRGFINAALAGPYQELFGRIDHLVMLKAPSFEVVLKWRIEQERKLKARLAEAGADPARTMSDEAIVRFISHYERLTRHILAEMPDRADVVVELDEDRRASAPR